MNAELYQHLLRALRPGFQLASAPEHLRSTIETLRPLCRRSHDTLYYIPPNDHRPRRIIPQHELRLTLTLSHDSAGHFGADNTRERVSRSFWWPSLRADVENFVRQCPACQLFRPSLRREPLHPIPVDSPFHTISIDTIGPLPSSHNMRYILVAVDHLTKWCETTTKVRNTAANTAAFLFEQIVCRHGCPTRLISDNGPEFAAEVVRLLTARLDIHHHFITPYRPQANGNVERLNRTLINSLQRTMFEPGTTSYRTDWADCLAAVTFAYNTLRHSSTGYSPFFLMYGREARLPVDLVFSTPPATAALSLEDQLRERVEQLTRLPTHHEQARLAVEQRQQAAARLYDSQLTRSREPTLREGDLVLRRDARSDRGHDNKFSPRWEGPFVIWRLHDNGTASLTSRDLIPEPRRAHIDQLRRYYPQTERLSNA